MVSGVFGVGRELPRLREISSILIRYGLGDLVRRAGVPTLLERTGQVLQWAQASEVAHLEPQQRARLALEQLGPTFVKLGQMLSTREDLLPSVWTDELSLVQQCGAGTVRRCLAANRTDARSVSI